MNLTLSRGQPLEKIEQIEAELLRLPQVECPLVHRFAPGVYLREIFMPAGTFIIGQQHKTEHFNIILRGRARVMVDGVVQIMEAPYTFVSHVDVRKVLYIEEDMVWQTVHPTHETDLKKLEAELIVHSASYDKHLDDMRALRAIVSEVSQ